MIDKFVLPNDPILVKVAPAIADQEILASETQK